jgi:cyclic pyranopterin phosphate synthase
MPNEQMQFLPNKHLMQVAEIAEIAALFVSLGVNKIRLTGGEPMVRREFPEILQRLSALPVKLTLTSNGIFAHKYWQNMQEAGIKSVNISLDTLNPSTFAQLTKRDQFAQVWSNIMLLLDKGFRVKINAVAVEGIIEQELLDFIALTKHLPLHLRFIEFMPFDGNQWNSQKVITAQQMLEQVKQVYDIEKLPDAPNATAKKYHVPGHAGTFAFITTMSEHFCGTCNRLRLTADGKMKNCLFGKEEIDLLSALRSGAPLLPLIQTSVMRKHAVMGGQFGQGYQGADPNSIQNRSMIKIGG